MSVRDTLEKWLLENDFITLNEARNLDITPMQLSRMVAKGELFRVERSIYTRDFDWLTDSLKKYCPACVLVPDAVISGVSALTYHNLTDQEERQIGITLPVNKRLKDPRYRITRACGANYSLGIMVHNFGEHEVRIYDIEKSVVDAFKYQTDEVAFKALKGYLQRKDKNVSKLCKYARKMRKPLDKIVAALIADN
ncbi:MAG: hypothetical protein JKY15_05930 [Deltaproteobacteria bacterium]|nr:hypothetical protein [Deltaproteobacteria bacterium]